MAKTKLILVGGFLGAGKTTLLHRASAILKQRGAAVGLITNDQASGLVDTAYLEMRGNVIREVSGSCFCCNFYGFLDAVRSVAEEIGGGVTIAESVGSCTDLSATIMQPVKDRYSDLITPSPLTVVADPERLRSVVDKRRVSRAYIVRKQLEEADVILINKTDLLTAEQSEELLRRTKERFSDALVLPVSAASGEGVDTWLDLVLNSDRGGSLLTDVDYDLYAEGEAAYGWLNATYTFAGPMSDEDASIRSEKLLEALADRISDAGLSVGHIKFLLQNDTAQWIGNLTGGAEPPALRIEQSPAGPLQLTVNARAETGPKTLQDLVLSAVDDAFAELVCTGTEIRTLIPGRPSPTFHYDRTVTGADG